MSQKVPPAQRASIMLLDDCAWCYVRVRAGISSSDEFQYRRLAGERSQIASMSLTIKPSLSLSSAKSRGGSRCDCCEWLGIRISVLAIRKHSSDLGRIFRDLYIFIGTSLPVNQISSSTLFFLRYSNTRIRLRERRVSCDFGLACRDIGCPNEQNSFVRDFPNFSISF